MSKVGSGNIKLNEMETLLSKTSKFRRQGRHFNSWLLGSAMYWKGRKTKSYGQKEAREGCHLALALGHLASWQYLLIESHCVQHLGEKPEWPQGGIQPFICVAGRPCGRAKENPGSKGACGLCGPQYTLCPEAKKIKYQSNKICCFPSHTNQIYNLSSTIRFFHQQKQQETAQYSDVRNSRIWSIKTRNVFLSSPLKPKAYFWCDCSILLYQDLTFLLNIFFSFSFSC